MGMDGSFQRGEASRVSDPAERSSKMKTEKSFDLATNLSRL